jgi:superfamily I DNA/RNA helicase
MPFQQRTHERLMERPAVRLLIRTMEALVEKHNPAHARRSVGEWLAAAAENCTSDSSKDEAAQLEVAVDLVTPLASRHDDDLETFLAELALGAEVDTWDPRAERISLLTLHAAKGLEFPAVFVVGCEDGLLPLTWVAGEVDLDEERRLFFVGMTRARSRLFLTRSRRRRWRGQLREPAPSPFLRDIEEGLVEQRRQTRRKPTRRSSEESGQLRLL